MANQTNSKQHWTWLLHGLGHATGVLVILCIHALVFVDENVVKALEVAITDAVFIKLVTWPLLIQIGLSCCFWALGVITYKWGRLTLSEQRKPKTFRLKKATGTIMTETLIVLPIFLLLTSGLSQLAINSSARILMAVATFQASRTAWLWEPETRGSNARNGMSGNSDAVTERARIAAATVLTPVAPAEFRGTCNYSNLFDQRMRGMALTGSFAGAGGAGAVQALTLTGSNGRHSEFYFQKAFDTSSFVTRGAKKFYLAYCMTSAEYTANGDNVVTSVTYNHSNVFPWFAYIFGEQRLVAGNLGYFTVMESNATLPKQIDANPREPLSLRATFDALIDSLGIP